MTLLIPSPLRNKSCSRQTAEGGPRREHRRLSRWSTGCVRGRRAGVQTGTRGRADESLTQPSHSSDPKRFFSLLLLPPSCRPTVNPQPWLAEQRTPTPRLWALEEERLDQIAREHKIAGQLEDRLGVLFASLLCARNCLSEGDNVACLVKHYVVT